MVKPMNGIFISYRREDAAGHAGRLFDRLAARFGKDSVFMDVEGIEAGVDFIETIDAAVGRCDVLLAVIGRGWLSSQNSQGKRRLDDPQDFVRVETASALARKVRVVPVLVEGAQMPVAEELPEDLRGLTRRQAVELRDSRWEADIQALIGVLERVLEPTSPTAPIGGSDGKERKRAAWAGKAGAAALLFVGAIVGYQLWPRERAAIPATPAAPPAVTQAEPMLPTAPKTEPPQTSEAPRPETVPKPDRCRHTCSGTAASNVTASRTPSQAQGCSRRRCTGSPADAAAQGRHHRPWRTDLTGFLGRRTQGRLQRQARHAAS
jgi:hypothetical protein